MRLVNDKGMFGFPGRVHTSPYLLWTFMPLTPHDAAAIGLVKRISRASDGQEVEVVFTAVVNFLAILISN